MQTADDLNDLRYVCAVAETGTLSGAARRLKVNHATVFRRIESFEKRLGAKLFERTKGRYLPTAAGEELARAGAEIEYAAAESLRKVSGRDLRASGLVRVTTTDSIAQGLVAPMAQACRQAHPGILLQVIMSNEFYNLSRRDADIAIRVTRKPPEHLIGKKTGAVAMAVYGALGYLKQRTGKDLARHDWIALDDSVGHNASLAWLDRIKRLDEVPYRTNSFMGATSACVAGLGLAVLPCFLGDQQPTLRRMTPALEECVNELWILTHPDLRHSVRVGTVFEALRQELGAAAPLLAGQRPVREKR